MTGVPLTISPIANYRDTLAVTPFAVEYEPPPKHPAVRAIIARSPVRPHTPAPYRDNQSG